MESYVVNLASRGAGLGPWTETRSLGHIRPGPGPVVAPGRGAVDPMPVPFEGDSPSPAGREFPEESEDGSQARMTASAVVNAAKPAPGVRPRPSLEDRVEIPSLREVSRTGNDALQMSGVQVTAPPVRPAVTDSQSGLIPNESRKRPNGRRRSARGQGPDFVVTVTESAKQDTADRDEPYPLTLPRPAVEPAVVFAQTRNGPRGDTEGAPGLSAKTVPSVSPAGNTENMPSRQEASAPSTRTPAARPTRHGVPSVRIYKNETFRSPVTGLADMGKISAPPPPETVEKTMPMVRPAADPSAAPVSAALTGLPAAGTGEGSRSPKAEPSVTVRIARVEVRAVHEPGKTTLPRSPVSAPPPAGFDEYRSLRNYEYWEP